MRREEDKDGGIKWEDPDSGMRRGKDDSMHSEKDLEDSGKPALKRIKINVDLEWVQLDGLILQVRDKDTLLGGFELTGMHIDMAQKLLKLQFPSLNSLGSALIADAPFLLGGLQSMCKFYIVMVITGSLHLV